MNNLVTGLTISAALLIGACSSNDPITRTSTDIYALWDVTETHPFTGEDIAYLRIFEDGSTIRYDYQQDEADAGDNCYHIGDTDDIISLGMDQFMTVFQSSDGDQNVILTMTRSGDILSISHEDVFDENEDGNTTDTFTSNFPLATGVDTEFNECT